MWAWTQPWGSWKYVGSAANDQGESLINYRDTYVSWVSADWPNSAVQACLPAPYYNTFLGGYRYGSSYVTGGGTISSFELSGSRTSCPYGSGFVLNGATPEGTTTSTTSTTSTTATGPTTTSAGALTVGAGASAETRR